MSLENTIDLLKTIAKAVNDSTDIADKLGIKELLDFSSQNTSKKSVYGENKDINTEANSNTFKSDNSSNDSNNTNTETNDYNYYTQKNTSSNSQSASDSIIPELTPAKMKEAVILSEIIGKPRSKTRRRRF